ncbi:efflux RND transporter permease subunit [Pontiellaceae bacterium B1224]|nr:efflux RND transporter permease subunit [Pontiellaceae bacterium B1224]
MSLTRTSINNPYGVVALALVVVALGLFAFFRTPTDLFPDSAPPQVSVITIEPGASSENVADKITQLVEKELNTISGLKRIRSTSRDEVSAVTAEFLYTKKIGEAVTDVQSAVARIESQLPADIQTPRIYRITDATRALTTLALSPKENSPKNLSMIRLLADNEIMDALLRVSGVGDVDVFGANQPEVQVRVDRDKLAAYGMSIDLVIGEIARQNVAAPAGTVYTEEGEYLVQVKGEFRNLDALNNLPVKRTPSGRVLLRDVATVTLATRETRSGYLGNGKEAIALNVMRPEGGNTMLAIRNVKKELEQLRLRYPDINFEITNDQQPVIDLNVQGMRSSVYQAVLLTIFIILIFLADVRAALAISISIPLAFLSALVVLWFSPYTMNMVTLSGVIIAVGMVVDASIVVLEIIYRKHREQPDVPVKQVAIEGAQEIFHGVSAGVFTTVIVLVPVMFAGGYTEQTMRPLNMMITATILSSLVAAFTIVPLVTIRLMAHPEPKISKWINRALSPFTRWMDRRTDSVANIAAWLLKHRILALLMAIPFIIFSMRVVKPLNGKELMPPMDTGVGIIQFDTPTHYTPHQVTEVAKQVEAMVRETSEGLQWVSTRIGSEPGQISFGGGGETAQAVMMTITLTDRKQRADSIWVLEERWREGLRKIDGVRTFDVTEYGATPLSTTKAPLDLVISGPDVNVLDTLADQLMERLKGVKGLTDVRRSWYIDKPEQHIVVDPDLARFYGLSPSEVARSLKTAVKGASASTMRLKGSLDIPITVQYAQPQMDQRVDLLDAQLTTPQGPVPLRAMASVSTVNNAPFITREHLSNTIDITGINSGMTIAQVGKQVQSRIKGFKLPADYTVQVSGTLDDMKTGGGEMGHALMIGLVLLYILLVWMYKSFVHPFTIMLSVLIPMAAAMWGMLIFDKPMCKPAIMGLILLAGTVVNNAILLLDYILKARAGGMSKDDAIVQAVRLRFRPIVMTAASTAIGLTPLIFELAVGMERMSPLGIVAAFGLIMGIFSSTWFYPVIYSLVDGGIERFKTPFKTTATAIPVLAVCLIGWAGNARAQTNAPVSMTLEQAVDYAQVHSPTLHMARADTGIARGNSTSARAGLLPQVDIVGNVLHSKEDHPVLYGLPSSLARYSDTTYSLGVEVKQLLWDFGQTWNRMEAARSLAAAADQSLNRTRNEVTFRVNALYHQRLMTDDLLRATEGTRKSLQQLVDNLEKRLAIGKAARLDLLKARVKLAAAESQMALLEAQQINAQGALLAAMGYDGPPVEWVQTTVEPSTAEAQDTEQLLDEAFVQRADFQALESVVESGSVSETAARRSRWPTITAFGQYAQYGADDPYSALGSSAGNQSDGWEGNYYIGLQLTFPIFDSGLRSGTIATAHAQRLKAEAQREQLRLQIRQQVRTAVAELKSASIRVEAFRQSVDEARQALSDEQEKYEAGKSTINDLLDAEAARLVADSQFSQAVHEEQIAVVNLRLAAGESLNTLDGK